ncbi:MAG: DNA polymerase III subunit delta [Bacteroidia bacterium]|nr:DNA polymerase III subunit delta [Bacteroidia bacterium]
MSALPEAAKKIIKDIGEKKFKPIYFLMGEEPYFIDKLASYMEDHVLEEADRSFNQAVHYGSDLDISRLVGEAKRYPMMSDYQLVIVKEAQLIKNLAGKEKKDKETGKEEEVKDVFLTYCESPLPSTILVICYKGKTIDKRKSLYKAIEKNGIVFNSEVIKDWNLSKWIIDFVKEKGYRINDKAAVMLADFLGNDLAKIDNEVSKLAISLPPNTEINELIIERNIGISKDYNVFELLKALSKQDTFKANQIINYFSKNQKENPAVVTIGHLYNYYSKLLEIHYHRTKGLNSGAIAEKMGIHPFVFKEYEEAAQRYSYPKIVKNVSSLRDFDLRIKGVESGELSLEDFYKEFIYKVIHTR